MATLAMTSSTTSQPFKMTSEPSPITSMATHSHSHSHSHHRSQQQQPRSKNPSAHPAETESPPPSPSTLPPWRRDLEVAIDANFQQDSAHLFASLATIKPYGRPANRTVFFRGFLSDVCLGRHAPHAITSTHHPHSHSRHRLPNPVPTPEEADVFANDEVVLEKINNVLVFAADVRSGSVDDIIHGSRFGEVCWFMPGTREQFRISGELHLVVSPDHPMSLSHRVPRPFLAQPGSSPNFAKIDWEAKRLEVWRRLSSVRRASFAWPAPGKPQGQPALEAMHRGLGMTDATNAPPGTSSEPPSSVFGGGLATSVPPPSLCSIITHLDAEPATATPALTAEPTTPASPNASFSDEASMGSAGGSPTRRGSGGSGSSSDPHAVALRNFCLLLLDVDGADHLCMSQVPHVRTKFRRSMEAAWSEDHLEDLFMNYGFKMGHEHHHHQHGNGKHQPAAQTQPHQRQKSGGSSSGSIDGMVKKVNKWTIKEVNP
ncbi:hypothetical protein HDU96_003560 [Phlyctochytrium bullatum]|nr:hypothetical protein HDU96_003560 [Phlyctochytrium bullatum]